MKAALGQAFLTEPKPLPVVDQHLDGRRAPVPKHEHGSFERIALERHFAEIDKTVDPFTKVDRVDGDQNLHLRRDLQHHLAFQKPWPSASTSGMLAPFRCTRIEAPFPSSNSIRHSLLVAGNGDDGNSKNGAFGALRSTC